MKKMFSIFFLVSSFLFAQTIQSPNAAFLLKFWLDAEGTPEYQLSYKEKPVLLPGKLGLILKDQASLDKGFLITKVDSTLHDDTWKPVWGEVKEIRNQYKELKITLCQPEAKNRTMILVFRLFNDGLGFRYEFPWQSAFDYFTVNDELTEFNLTDDHTAFWIPGDYDSNEFLYTTSPLSAVDAMKGIRPEDAANKSRPGKNYVQTPLMLKSRNGFYINIHEAALVNYPAMNLAINQKTFSLSSHLVPNAVGSKAFLQTPCVTPWRTIIVSDKAADILDSKMILNLNEPSKLKDVNWIIPQKFIGVWWEMHVGLGSWNYTDSPNVKLTGTDWNNLKPNGRHSANTARVKQYIDFASANNIPGVLVEGWNIGWEDWFGKWKEEVFDFITPYKDFDVTELHRYAASKGVKLIMHHETSASATNYERRMDEAYRFMKENGYDAVKTGYVGRIIPRGEHHDGQWMVNHYIHVAEKTAENKIMLDAHEPVRPTGLHRTYPNWFACEAARGNEYNGWSEGNTPEHETILPFTRLIGGPMDYTPGIFQIKLDHYVPGKKECVHTTLVKQLALYVTLYSPLQMAADLPETYQRFSDAFQFIKDVAVDWDDTKIIEAEPGDYITIARKAKNKEEWYIGAITDEHKRTAVVPLTFLEPGQTYIATLYLDGQNAHWDKNPMAYTIKKVVVTAKTELKLNLAEGGGAAVSIKIASGL